MSTPIHILLFLLANGIGFLSVSIVYYAAYGLGLITPEMIENGAVQFKTHFLGGVMLVWIGCAFIGLAGFFLKSVWKYAFLAAPAIVPLIYGLSALLMLTAV